MAGSVADLLGGGSNGAASAAPPPGFVLQDALNTPPPPGFVLQGDAPKDSGMLANLAQGIPEALENGGSMIRDAILNPRAIFQRAADMAARVNGYEAAQGPQSLTGLAAIPADVAARKQSNSVVAATPAERIGRSAVAGAVGGVINPESVGATVAQMLFGGASGLGAGVAAEAAPDNLKPLASVLGGAVAPAAGALAHPLSRALAPFTSAVSQGSAEAQAGRTIAARATDPQAAALALEQPSEIVPGSQPTTFQQTGDMGLGALEREAATRDPAAFQQRAAEQNTARRAALDGVETGGDPNDVAKALKQQFDDLNAHHDETVEAAAKAAHDKTATALGPDAHPEEIGAQLRGAITDVHEEVAAQRRALYEAVDPDKSLTANTVGTSQAAHQIPSEIPSTAKPMAGEEAAVFDAARNLPAVAPLQDLIALQGRTNDAMAQAKLGGEMQTYRRLTMLRGAIEDNLSHTIAQQVASDAAHEKAGILDPSQTTAARVQSWLNDWQTARASRPDDSASVPGGSPSGSPSAAGVLRAEGAAPEGSGSPSRAEGLPGNAPTVDAAARQRLAAASQAYAHEQQTFAKGPVGDALKTLGRKDDFRLPNGAVAGRFFRPGTAGFEQMRSLLATGAQDALPTIERFAATTLRRAALKADGTLDAGKFAQWQKAYSDALRALPAETRAKFASAARASEALTDAQAARVTAVKAAQQGAIGKVMGLSTPEDVVKTVGSILNGRTAVADMKGLATATARDPIARQGLRRAIADYIAAKFVGNTEAGASGESLIKADAYQSFIRQSRAALHLVFTPEEVRTMEAVAEDIQRAKRSQNAVRLPGGSNTAQDSAPMARAMTKLAGQSWLHVVGAALGSTLGPLGAVGGVLTAHIAQALRARGITRVDSLVSEAMLDPRLARELLKKAPRKSANWNAGSAPLTAALWSDAQPKKDRQ